MRTIQDLKIGEIVWKVSGDSSIEETIVESLSRKEIITSRADYKISSGEFNVDRLTNHFNSTLCITYLDAVDLATTICLAKIKEHSDEVTKRLSAIQAVGLRIHELNDIKQNIV